MKPLLIGALTLLAIGSAAQAAVTEVKIAPEMEPVRSIPALTGLHSWQVIDERRLIVWATAFDPYLVELALPSHDLRFATAIGVTSAGSRVHAGFDSVRVAGFNYPIRNIYRLDREQVRSNRLTW